MSDGESIVVAVRVRPFNEREKQRKAQLIIEMPDGKQTGIRDPNAPGEDPKWFSFDHSYWSHDGYKENASGYLEPIDDRYADQGHRDLKDRVTYQLRPAPSMSVPHSHELLRCQSSSCPSGFAY
uniref:Kinesin motor domain-containing protein n=1 Tax=Ascaris lumbricoides TaxID=6252 RepID=A0A0M3IR87_ASCLU